MARAWTKTEAFEHFGVELENVQWSWSGISRDGGRVAVVLWQDGVKMHEGHLAYYDDQDLDAEWRDRIGNKRRVLHLVHAREKLDGCFQAIIAKAADRDADLRKIEKCFPQVEGHWLLEFLDEETGAFRAHIVRK